MCLLMYVFFYLCFVYIMLNKGIWVLYSYVIVKILNIGVLYIIR